MLLWSHALCVLVVTSFSYDSFQIPKILISSIMFFALCIKLFRQKSMNIVFSPLQKISLQLSILFFISIIFIGLFTSDSLFGFIYGEYPRFNGFIFFFLFTSTFLLALLTANLSSTQLFLKQQTYLGFVLSIYAFMERSGVRLFDVVNETRDTNITDEFTVGTFGNSNGFSQFISLSAIASLGLIFCTDLRSKKILFFSFTIFEFSAIFFLGDDQSVINAIMGLLIFIVLFIVANISVKSIFAYSLGMIFSLAAIATFYFIRVRNEFSEIIQTLPVSYLDRLFIWKTSVDIIRNTNLFGTGFDGYSNSFRISKSKSFYNYLRNYQGADYATGFEREVNNAHNFYLQIASVGGLLTLVLFATLILIVFWNSFTVLRESWAPELWVALTFGITCMFSQLYTTPTLPNAMTLMLSLGILAHYSKTTDVIKSNLLKNVRGQKRRKIERKYNYVVPILGTILIISSFSSFAFSFLLKKISR